MLGGRSDHLRLWFVDKIQPIQFAFLSNNLLNMQQDQMRFSSFHQLDQHPKLSPWKINHILRENTWPIHSHRFPTLHSNLWTIVSVDFCFFNSSSLFWWYNTKSCLLLLKLSMWRFVSHTSLHTDETVEMEVQTSIIQLPNKFEW